MDVIVPILLAAVPIALITFIMCRHRKKGDDQCKYLYRKDQEIYYFDNGDFIINVLPPYRPRFAPITEIDHLVFRYDIFSVEKTGGDYTVNIDIVKKDGTTIKGPGVVTKRFGNTFDPKKAAEDIKVHGIRCELPTGKGGIWGNRPN